MPATPEKVWRAVQGAMRRRPNEGGQTCSSRLSPPLGVGSGQRFANSDAKYLAGGQTLVPTLKQRLARPADLIDLAASRS